MVVTTPAFIELSEKCARENRLEGARIAVVPHPIGGSSTESLTERADHAVDALLSLLSA